MARMSNLFLFFCLFLGSAQVYANQIQTFDPPPHPSPYTD